MDQFDRSCVQPIRSLIRRGFFCIVPSRTNSNSNICAPLRCSQSESVFEEVMAKLFRAAIMGPPGSGKGTISKRIAQSFGLQYLSSGHYLRESITANTGRLPAAHALWPKCQYCGANAKKQPAEEKLVKRVIFLWRICAFREFSSR